MSNIIEVEITISQLVHDLRAGLTWFESENQGHGSIQHKYEMEEEDVMDIMAHPAFNKPIRTFKIVDDYSKSATPVQQKVKVENPFVTTTVTINKQEEVTEDAGSLEFLSL